MDNHITELRRYVQQVTGVDGGTQSTGRPCLMRLLGKQCRRGRGWDDNCLGCLYISGWIDHPTAWTKDRKTVAIVLQPYDLYREGDGCPEPSWNNLEHRLSELGLWYSLGAAPFYHHLRDWDQYRTLCVNTIVITAPGGQREPVWKAREEVTS